MEVLETPLFEPVGDAAQLGIDEMDKTHDEFIQLVNQLASAPNTEFRSLFQKLLRHTREHFSREQELMEESSFPAIDEHTSEHQRILGELDRFNNKVKDGIFMFARAYIREQMPEWFKLHLATMDSALAAHLNLIKKG